MAGETLNEEEHLYVTKLKKVDPTALKEGELFMHWLGSQPGAPAISASVGRRPAQCSGQRIATQYTHQLFKNRPWCSK
jgi:hypothetical protein